MYGIDLAGPLSLSDKEYVRVPPLSSSLSDLQFQELLDTICPLYPSPNHGIDLYISTLQFLMDKINVPMN